MYVGTWAQESPERAAAVNSQTSEIRSYRDLDERSNQVAHYLHGLGLRRGDHFAIFMENSLTYLDVAWAALRSGLYLTPINRYLNADEAAYILEDCDAQVLVSSRKMGAIATKLRHVVPSCSHWLSVGHVPGYEDFETAIAECSRLRLAEQPAGDLLFYSSGTTGKPKGIVRPLPDRSVDEPGSAVATLQSQLWGVDSNAIYLSPAPLYHASPLAFCLSVHMLGGTAVVMPRFDELAALEAIERWRVTHSQWVPTMFSRMLKLPEVQRLRWDLSSHRVALHAASPCPIEVKHRMFEWWGPILYEFYAGTELNGFTHAGPQDWLNHPGTVGKPVLGIIHICGEDGDELPAGQAGTVYFELPEVPFRYRKSPEKNKEARHPQHSNWTTLGDVGHVDEAGYLFLTDRATFMIISGGVNIYPQEVENALIMHPAVEDIAVFGVPDADLGEEVKAVVQVRPEVVADDALAEELIAYARERLAHFKCPKSVDFIDRMPRQPTGKLFKRLLKDKYSGRGSGSIV